MSIAQRQSLSRALTSKDKETNEPPSSHEPEVVISPGHGRPLAHGDVKKVIQSKGLGQVLLDMSMVPYMRTKMAAKIITLPTQNTPGEMVLEARYCSRCDLWHQVDQDERMPIPSVEVQYFEIHYGRTVEEEATPDCRDWDAGSDVDSEVGTGQAVDINELEGISPSKLALDFHRTIRNDENREPIYAGMTLAPGQYNAELIRKYYIYPDRPPTIHKMVWNQLSSETRKEHVRWLYRLINMPPELSKAPLPQACIDLVLRFAAERKWSWPTISSKMSAVASALKYLPLHSTATTGINLREDPVYGAALQYAQKRARVDALFPKQSAPLEKVEFEKLSKELVGGPWVLLQLAWYLAGRVGDVRRLQPRNITFGSAQENGDVEFSALFVEGKGAFFWGPYTIATTMPLSIAKSVQEYLKSRETCVCSTADQAALSKRMALFPDHSLRSVRRGKLVHLAKLGADNNSLQLLSGHRRKDTLLRYLGWGRFDSDAKRAAAIRSKLESRDEPEVVGAGVTQEHPMWMGFNSGYNSRTHGRREGDVPQLFALKPPSAEDLGIGEKKGDEQKAWKLHVKDVPTLKDIANCHKHVKDPMLRDATELATSWTQTPKYYGVSESTALVEQQLPYVKYTPEQILRILEGSKMVPYQGKMHGAIKSAVKGWPRAEPSKERYRPLFEPLHNASAKKEYRPPCKYPSRRSRRGRIAGRKYVLQFDMAAYYDQFPLDRTVEGYYVLRTQEAIKWEDGEYNLFVLTRGPMGAGFMCHTAQTVTWAICEPLLKMEEIVLHTMIDNVLVASDNPISFTTAVRTFLKRCELFGATLKNEGRIDVEWLRKASNEEILELAEMAKGRSEIFLGEEFLCDGTVSNTAVHVEKLRCAYRRLQASLSDETIKVTRRHLASIMSLATWMSHTLDIHMSEYFEFMRLYGRNAREAAESGWDKRIRRDEKAVNTIGELIVKLLDNTPVTPMQSTKPDIDNSAYDAVVILDAWEQGYGAYVHVGGDILEVSKGFNRLIPHSAWSETIAAKELIQFCRTKTKGKIAIVTDHYAMPAGQRRPESGNGGFSLAYHLNETFRTLYSSEGNGGEIFYCPGERNITDWLSRQTRVGMPRRIIKRCDMTFPNIDEFYHPYVDDAGAKRAWWNV